MRKILNELVIISMDKTTEYHFAARTLQEQQALQNLKEFTQYLEYELRVFKSSHLGRNVDELKKVYVEVCCK
jgi:hypothetical protein